MSVPIRLSRSVKQQIVALDENRFASLRNFLKGLSENPFATDLVKTFQIDEFERYSHESPGEYMVYWRMISVRRSSEVPHLNLSDWRIELLELKSLR